MGAGAPKSASGRVQLSLPKASRTIEFVRKLVLDLELEIRLSAKQTSVCRIPDKISY